MIWIRDSKNVPHDCSVCKEFTACHIYVGTKPNQFIALCSDCREGVSPRMEETIK